MLEDEKYRAVILRGPFKDLSDVLRIARHQGKRIFKCKRVNVHPHINYNHDNTELIVKVKPEANLFDVEL